MTKEEKTVKVKDLLNQVIVLCGRNMDGFLQEVSQTVKDLLKVEDTNSENPEDEYGTSEYYDSSANC